MRSKSLRIAGYLVICGMLSVIALEVAIRLYAKLPVFELRDWRSQPGLLQTAGAIYDPFLGWGQIPNIDLGGFATLDYGVRKNSNEPETLTPGAILAVGDSFTAGSEVVNQDTWPARLERMLRLRVLNAGVGGYGVDQIVLNAEKLSAILKPRLVLVGIYEGDIVRVNYKNYNAPKPYFVKRDGQWMLENIPVPAESGVEPEPLYKTILSYSFGAHVLFLRTFPDWWYSGGRARYVKASDSPAETSCYALERLQRSLAPQGIPAMVVLQYGGWIYSSRRPRPAYVDEVLQCAQRLQYGIVDEFDHLSAIARDSLDALKKHFVMSNNDASYGHMSAEGNKLIASLIADKIRASVDIRDFLALPSPKR